MLAPGSSRRGCGGFFHGPLGASRPPPRSGAPFDTPSSRWPSRSPMASVRPAVSMDQPQVHTTAHKSRLRLTWLTVARCPSTFWPNARLTYTSSPLIASAGRSAIYACCPHRSFNARHHAEQSGRSERTVGLNSPLGSSQASIITKATSETTSPRNPETTLAPCLGSCLMPCANRYAENAAATSTPSIQPPVDEAEARAPVTSADTRADCPDRGFHARR